MVDPRRTRTYDEGERQEFVEEEEFDDDEEDEDDDEDDFDDELDDEDLEDEEEEEEEEEAEDEELEDEWEEVEDEEEEEDWEDEEDDSEWDYDDDDEEEEEEERRGLGIGRRSRPLAGTEPRTRMPGFAKQPGSSPLAACRASRVALPQIASGDILAPTSPVRSPGSFLRGHRQADRQFVQLLAVHFTGRLGHQVRGPLRLGERDAVADAFQPAEQHHDAVDAQRDPAVRRSAELQGFQQEAEPLAGPLFVDAQQVEHLLLQLAVVDPDGAAACFRAVDHQIVSLRPALGRLRLQQFHDPAAAAP